jgi:hypothetical protein
MAFATATQITKMISSRMPKAAMPPMDDDSKMSKARAAEVSRPASLRRLNS